MNSPFSNLKLALDTDFPAGTVVMFDHEGSPITGIVSGLKKDRYQILCLNLDSHKKDSHQKETFIELSKNRLHKVPCPPIEGTQQEMIKGLEYLISDPLTPEQIEELWTKIINSPSAVDIYGKSFHPAELTKNLTLDINAKNYVKVRSSLILDKVFFRRDEKGFIPRKPKDIEQKKEEEQNRLKRHNDYRLLVTFLRARAKDKTLTVPAELEFYIEQLKACAALASYPEESWHQQIEELIHFIEAQHPDFEGRIEARAFHILYKAGILKKDSNLTFIRHKPRIEFDEKILEAAKKLTLPDSFEEYIDHAIRMDLTHQKAFTIDDSSTKDMDDAIFLEETNDGYTLYVHISDVAYLINKDSLLDIEARKRATSTYCPEVEIPMLPAEISHNTASLVANHTRPAITTIFEINRDFQIVAAHIEPSVIKVTDRYSYDQIDQKLKEYQEPFTTIQSIASLHEQKRLDDGALPVTKRDAQPVLLEGQEIAVVEVDEQSPARALIGEMMVLTNIVAANFLRANEIPALYRGQEKPDTDLSLLDIPEGSARFYAERGKLKRSTVDVIPRYHATLGTNAYVQTTSPIRRYLDLVLQRQMLSFFRNERFPYSERELTSLHSSLDDPLQISQSVSKESKRFWMLRYLEKYYTDNRSIFGTVVRTDTKFPIVELDELFINVPAKINRPKLGQRYELKIERVDPRSDFIRLEEQRRR